MEQEIKTILESHGFNFDVSSIEGLKSRIKPIFEKYGIVNGEIDFDYVKLKMINGELSVIEKPLYS